MRIAIIAMGTRGDVQPYLALGKGLQAAGHLVRLITHENFAQLVSSYGLDVATHNTNRSGPQSSQFWDQIKCNYPVV
jgi:sterol 3beta-glucosyltransferase